MSRLFVGGLSERISRCELERQFSAYGRVNDCFINRNNPSIGFVTYNNYHDAENAMKQLNGRYVHGHRLRVEPARGGRGGGGSRGGSMHGGPYHGNISGTKCFNCGGYGHTGRQCNVDTTGKSNTNPFTARKDNDKSESKANDKSFKEKPLPGMDKLLKNMKDNSPNKNKTIVTDGESKLDSNSGNSSLNSQNTMSLTETRTIKVNGIATVGEKSTTSKSISNDDSKSSDDPKMVKPPDSNETSETNIKPEDKTNKTLNKPVDSKTASETNVKTGNPIDDKMNKTLNDSVYINKSSETVTKTTEKSTEDRIDKTLNKSVVTKKASETNTNSNRTPTKDKTNTIPNKLVDSKKSTETITETSEKSTDDKINTTSNKSVDTKKAIETNTNSKETLTEDKKYKTKYKPVDSKKTMTSETNAETNEKPVENKTNTTPNKLVVLKKAPETNAETNIKPTKDERSKTSSKQVDSKKAETNAESNRKPVEDKTNKSLNNPVDTKKACETNIKTVENPTEDEMNKPPNKPVDTKKASETNSENNTPKDKTNKTSNKPVDSKKVETNAGTNEVPAEDEANKTRSKPVSETNIKKNVNQNEDKTNKYPNEPIGSIKTSDIQPSSEIPAEDIRDVSVDSKEVSKTNTKEKEKQIRDETNKLVDWKKTNNSEKTNEEERQTNLFSPDSELHKNVANASNLIDTNSDTFSDNIDPKWNEIGSTEKVPDDIGNMDVREDVNSEITAFDDDVNNSMLMNDIPVGNDDNDSEIQNFTGIKDRNVSLEEEPSSGLTSLETQLADEDVSIDSDDENRNIHEAFGRLPNTEVNNDALVEEFEDEVGILKYRFKNNGIEIPLKFVWVNIDDCSSLPNCPEIPPATRKSSRKREICISSESDDSEDLVKASARSRKYTRVSYAEDDFNDSLLDGQSKSLKGKSESKVKFSHQSSPSHSMTSNISSILTTEKHNINTDDDFELDTNLDNPLFDLFPDIGMADMPEDNLFHDNENMKKSQRKARKSTHSKKVEKTVNGSKNKNSESHNSDDDNNSLLCNKENGETNGLTNGKKTNNIKVAEKNPSKTPDKTRKVPPLPPRAVKGPPLPPGAMRSGPPLPQGAVRSGPPLPPGAVRSGSPFPGFGSDKDSINSWLSSQFGDATNDTGNKSSLETTKKSTPVPTSKRKVPPLPPGAIRGTTKDSDGAALINKELKKSANQSKAKKGSGTPRKVPPLPPGAFRVDDTTAKKGAVSTKRVPPLPPGATREDDTTAKKGPVGARKVPPLPPGATREGDITAKKGPIGARKVPPLPPGAMREDDTTAKKEAVAARKVQPLPPGARREDDTTAKKGAVAGKKVPPLPPGAVRGDDTPAKKGAAAAKKVPPLPPGATRENDTSAKKSPVAAKKVPPLPPGATREDDTTAMKGPVAAKKVPPLPSGAVRGNDTTAKKGPGITRKVPPLPPGAVREDHALTSNPFSPANQRDAKKRKMSSEDDATTPKKVAKTKSTPPLPPGAVRKGPILPPGVIQTDDNPLTELFNKNLKDPATKKGEKPSKENIQDTTENESHDPTKKSKDNNKVLPGKMNTPKLLSKKTTVQPRKMPPLPPGAVRMSPSVPIGLEGINGGSEDSNEPLSNVQEKKNKETKKGTPGKQFRKNLQKKIDNLSEDEMPDDETPSASLPEKSKKIPPLPPGAVRKTPTTGRKAPPMPPGAVRLGADSLGNDGDDPMGSWLLSQVDVLSEKKKTKKTVKDVKKGAVKTPPVTTKNPPVSTKKNVEESLPEEGSPADEEQITRSRRSLRSAYKPPPPTIELDELSPSSNEDDEDAWAPEEASSQSSHEERYTPPPPVNNRRQRKSSLANKSDDTRTNADVAKNDTPTPTLPGGSNMFGNGDGASTGLDSWLENQVNQLDKKKKQYEKSVQFNIEQNEEEKTHKKPRLLSEEIKKASQSPPKSPTHPKLLLKNIQQKLHGEEDGNIPDTVQKKRENIIKDMQNKINQHLTDLSKLIGHKAGNEIPSIMNGTREKVVNEFKLFTKKFTEDGDIFKATTATEMNKSTEKSTTIHETCKKTTKTVNTNKAPPIASSTIVKKTSDQPEVNTPKVPKVNTPKVNTPTVTTSKVITPKETTPIVTPSKVVPKKNTSRKSTSSNQKSITRPQITGKPQVATKTSIENNIDPPEFSDSNDSLIPTPIAPVLKTKKTITEKKTNIKSKNNDQRQIAPEEIPCENIDESSSELPTMTYLPQRTPEEIRSSVLNFQKQKKQKDTDNRRSGRKRKNRFGDYEKFLSDSSIEVIDVVDSPPKKKKMTKKRRKVETKKTSKIDRETTRVKHMLEQYDERQREVNGDYDESDDDDVSAETSRKRRQQEMRKTIV